MNFNRFCCNHIPTFKSYPAKIFDPNYPWHLICGWTFQWKNSKQLVKSFKCCIIPVCCKYESCPAYVYNICYGNSVYFKMMTQLVHFRIDDIEDNSCLRRGVPVAHSIYGVASTINAANYVFFLALEKVQQLGHPDVSSPWNCSIRFSRQLNCGPFVYLPGYKDLHRAALRIASWSGDGNLLAR